MKSLKTNIKNFMDTVKADVRELVKPDKPLTRWDYLLVLFVVIGAYIVFDASTIMQTASVSFGYLNRQFLNFYDYGKACGMTELIYMPAVYVTYAIWNLPLKLSFLVRYPMPEVPYYVQLWYKLLPILFYLACTYLVYKLALEIGMGHKKSKLCALAAFTMPVGFFLQFSYGQIMVMPLFFMLLGLWYYLKDRRWGFVFCYAVAIAYQQYVLVLFLLLLLLKEKRLRQLCENLLVAILPFALEYLLYSRSNAFRQHVELFDINADFAAGMDNGIFVIQYVVLLWILLLSWAYFTNIREKKELASYALFFVGLTGVVTLCLTDWRVEYFMLLVPVSVLSAFLHKDMRIFLILDMCWGVLLALYMVVQGFMPDSLDMVASLYTVLMVAIAVFKHPAFLAERQDELFRSYAGWMRVRFLCGAALCLVPSLAVMLLG